MQDLRYEDFITAKSISIRYDFFSLLRLSPKISKIQSESVYVDMDKLPSSDSNESASFNTAFEVKNILLKNTKIKYDKKLYSFDINASKIYFQESLSVQKIALVFKSSYADVHLDGSIAANVLRADSTIAISSVTSKEYLDFLQTPPKTLKCKLQADTQNVELFTKLQTLKFKEIQELELKDVEANLNYSIKEQKLNSTFVYTLLYDEYTLKTKQNVQLTLDGNFTSAIDVKVVNSPFVLPFTNINAKIFGDSTKVAMQIDADKLHYKLKSDDYKNFSIEGKAKELELSFIKELPELLQKDNISFINKVDLQLSPLSLNSTIKVNSLYYNLDAKVNYKHEDISAIFTLNPKQNSLLFKDMPIEKFSPIKGDYTAKESQERVILHANILEMTLLKNGSTITGDGTLASNRFTLTTKLDTKEPLELKVDTQISSLKETLKAFEVSKSDLSAISDVRVDINSTIVLSEPHIVNSSFYVPSVAYKADEQTTHLVQNITAKTSFSENILTLHNYTLEYKTHSIYSNKSSQILLKNNFDIFFKEFWIFDTLLLSGVYKTEEQAGNFSLKSNKFHYKDENADVKVKMDLNANFDLNSTKVQGRVTLLDGNISYMPSSDYSISDPDIIIIKDVKKKKESDVLMDIKIDSSKDILYINKNANVYVQPDLRLLKTSTKDMHIEGKMIITKGEINLSDKKFVFDVSELYFNGSIPINPKLNLNLHYYTLDYIDISIYVTHTLEEPVFIFSSNPALSQNDIMSYILFGESANTMFNSSSDSSKTSLLLGTGMRELFNTNSSMQLDTLNILTNSDGTIGYEIGSRFNKDMRIVYKNDTVSSVILQYNLSKSTRVDVDVRETGQGVSFIYLRDF